MLKHVTLTGQIPWSPGGRRTEFRFVTASVRRAARLQREYVEAFLETANTDRGSIGEQFAELCAQIDHIVEDYEERYAATSDQLDCKLVLNAARELLVWTKNLQLQRAWLDAATTPPIDLGSFYYFSGLAKAIVRDDSELTIVATHEGSYATVVNPFRQPAHPVPHGIVLVALIPHRETSSGLLHPLLAHEIGHGVAKVHGYTDRLQARLQGVMLRKHSIRAQLKKRNGRSAHQRRSALSSISGLGHGSRRYFVTGLLPRALAPPTSFPLPLRYFRMTSIPRDQSTLPHANGCDSSSSISTE